MSVVRGVPNLYVPTEFQVYLRFHCIPLKKLTSEAVGRCAVRAIYERNPRDWWKEYDWSHVPISYEDKDVEKVAFTVLKVTDEIVQLMRFFSGEIHEIPNDGYWITLKNEGGED